jgi:hypothetical protein
MIGESPTEWATFQKLVDPAKWSFGAQQMIRTGEILIQVRWEWPGTKGKDH